jgi:hypothetical protein
MERGVGAVRGGTSEMRAYSSTALNGGIPGVSSRGTAGAGSSSPTSTWSSSPAPWSTPPLSKYARIRSSLLRRPGPQKGHSSAQHPQHPDP